MGHTNIQTYTNIHRNYFKKTCIKNYIRINMNDMNLI
jgi:hypothetical protein